MYMKLKETTCLGKCEAADGVLKRVKVLGNVSKNGNLYPKTTRQKANSILEGLHVNLNHLGKNSEPQVEKKFGKLVNITHEDDGSYADLHFLTSHPMAKQVQEAAQTMPDLYGFSIQGTGTGKKKGKNFMVESIDNLMSVDLVSTPATTKGLYEQEEPMDETESKTCEEIMGELIAALVAEGKEDYVKDAIKLKKKISGGDEEEPEEMDSPDEPVEESWKRDYNKLKLEKACRQLVESVHLTAEQPLIDTLVSLPDDVTRNTFLSWHKKKSPVKQTKSSQVITEAVKTPDLVQILRGN